MKEYWIIDPTTSSILVYYMEDEYFDIKTYTFNDSINVNIYDDLIIDFKTLDI